MSSTGVDRITGIDPSVALKAPCVAATTVNITLSGARTIDTLAVLETTPPTRVAVRAQTNAVENGIYDVKNNAWVRSDDFNGSRDVVDGTLVSIVDGSVYKGGMLKVITADPVVIGTSEILWDLANAIDVITVVGTSGVDTYTKLRALTSSFFSPGDIVKCTGGGIVGEFKVTDTTVTDNTSTRIVAADNTDRHYARLPLGKALAEWGEVIHDGVTVNTVKNQRMVDDFPDIEFSNTGDNATARVEIPQSLRSLRCYTTFVPSVNSIFLFQIANDTGRNITKRIEGLRIAGNGKTGITGLRLGKLTDSPSPGAWEAVLYLHLEDLYVKNCHTGFDAYMVMELTAVNVVCFSNTIGLKMFSDPINGGANANTFLGCRWQSNEVGILIANDTSVLPLQHNLFSGGSVQGNSLCGVYIDSNVGGGTDSIVFDNVHFELNGNGVPASAVHEGFTVLRSTMHLNGSARVKISNSSLNDDVTPAFVLKNGANLILQDVTGYGNPLGDLVSVDATSKVFEYGYVDAIGYREIERFADFIRRAGVSAMINGPAILNFEKARNDCPFASCAIPSLTNTTGITAIGINKDEHFGLVSFATYNNIEGSTSTNRNYWIGPSGSTDDYLFQSFLVKSDKDTAMRFYYLFPGVARNKVINLRANEWRRIVFMDQAPGSNALELYIYPADTEAATLEFKAMQMVRTPNKTEISKFYSEGTVGVPDHRYEALASKPTGGAYVLGEVTYKNNISIDGNQMILDHWVCTLAGSPGTQTEQYIPTVTPAT